MADENTRAAQYRNEAKQTQSPTPTPAERERMRREAEAASQDAATKDAYDKASPIGKSISQTPPPPPPPSSVERKAKGGFIRSADGIAKRGKTRGKMV